MNVKNLVICDSKIIFNILDEIKDELNYNLLFKTKKDLLELKNLEDYLILTESPLGNLKNLIIVSSLPIEIKKLIEKINIGFLKKNFNFQSEIKIGAYNINLNSRVLSKQNKSLDLTEKEALMIIYLKNRNNPCSINELQKFVWKQSADLETHTVETHIYRLRKKIKNKFQDDKFIKSFKNGYKII